VEGAQVLDLGDCPYVLWVCIWCVSGYVHGYMVCVGVYMVWASVCAVGVCMQCVCVCEVCVYTVCVSGVSMSCGCVCMLCEYVVCVCVYMVCVCVVWVCVCGMCLYVRCVCVVGVYMVCGSVCHQPSLASEVTQVLPPGTAGSPLGQVQTIPVPFLGCELSVGHQ